VTAGASGRLEDVGERAVLARAGELDGVGEFGHAVARDVGGRRGVTAARRREACERDREAHDCV
jgi:hypothetical protein